MTAYYNEFDPKAAAWLRQLIKNGAIADGEVDERSIIDVQAVDLKGYSQHHFFAGIGVWSYALRGSGWVDDRPVWTASLPCQPFSVAGNQKGKEDERHLLPHFIELVKQCQPDTIFGEQVESAIRHEWLDDLQANMEREGYAVGHCVLGAHSVNAAHIRKRLYWVADTNDKHGRQQQQFGLSERERARDEFSGSGDDGRVGDTKHDGYSAGEKPRGNEEAIQCGKEGQDSPGEPERAGSPGALSGEPGGMGDTNCDGCEEGRKTSEAARHGSSIDAASGVDWLYCRDNKYRPIKSSIKPLVDGVARGVVHSSDSIITPNATGEARTTRIKGYGNAIQADIAKEFISVFMEVAP